MPTTIYVASAGTGKTTALINHELTETLKTTSPERVIFTTFTNAGADEAAKRAMEFFPQYRPEQFRYFRTLHSLAYRNIPFKKMMAFGDYVSLGRQLRYPINASKALSSKDGVADNKMNKGDHHLHLNMLMRTRCLSYEEVAQTQQITRFSVNELREFDCAYRTYRQQFGKYDFADQLEIFLASLDEWNPDITHLFVDEAQDLSTIQWQIVHKISEKTRRTVVAGDDKQSIYKFSGGDPSSLINLEGERKILGTSYRLPTNLLHFSERIAARILEKQAYTIQSTEEGGAVHRIRDIPSLPLHEGTWFLLARNRKFLEYFETSMMRAGYLYESDSGDSLMKPELIESIQEWEQMLLGYPVSFKSMKTVYKDYLRGTESVTRGSKTRLYLMDDDESVTRDQLKTEFGLLDTRHWSEAFTLPKITRELLMKIEAKEGLGAKPRIRISTIHGVKGMEADNVVILPDLSYLTEREYRQDPDNEHRVFYVAATRARKCLYIHQPLTDNYYRL